MSRVSKTRSVLAASAALLVGASMAPPASAHGYDHHHHSPDVRTIADGLVPPGLGLAVHRDGTVYVAQSFAGLATKVSPRGDKWNVVNDGEGHFVAGLDLGWRNSLYYLIDGSLKVNSRGHTRTVANVAAYEIANNPDQGNTYGFQGLGKQCLDKLPTSPPPSTGEEGPPDYRPHPGDVNPNPYAVLAGPLGSAIVADAGGNSLLWVSPRGHVRLLTVLPPVPTVITSTMAESQELDPCTVDATFNFEPVPTDVEWGSDGMLYVSGLPGGPEDASMGARGVVFRVNPWNGRVKQIASGFAGAVDLAVDRHGDIYVAELFGNAISKVVQGHAERVLDLPAPGALEYSNGRLYATTGDSTGKVVSFRP